MIFNKELIGKNININNYFYTVKEPVENGYYYYKCKRSDDGLIYELAVSEIKRALTEMMEENNLRQFKLNEENKKKAMQFDSELLKKLEKNIELLKIGKDYSNLTLSEEELIFLYKWAKIGIFHDMQ